MLNKKLLIKLFTITILLMLFSSTAYAFELAIEKDLDVETNLLNEIDETKQEFNLIQNDDESNLLVELANIDDTDHEEAGLEDYRNVEDELEDILTNIEEEISENETKKTETKQTETKQAETKKVETKKVETKKVETKKVETKKAATKKAATKKAAAKKPSYSQSDLRLLSALIYAEAGGESYQGKLAVANVVLNRVKSNLYSHANTVKAVVYDNKWARQFSVTIKNKNSGVSSLDRALKLYDTGTYPGRNQKAEKKAMDNCIKAAKAALEGENNIGKYISFNAVNSSTSSIKRRYPGYKIIGGQIFYRTK